MNVQIQGDAALAGIPDGLRGPLIDEYNKLARNFRESRWEPAELNGGKLCEIVYSIVQGHVEGQFPTGPTKPQNMYDACKQLEKATGFPRAIRIQIPRILVSLYEIRNNRNVGHVGADVDPNHMDATVVFAMVRWVMGELIRIFHGTSPDNASQIVDALTERSIPILWKVGGNKLSTKDKMMTLLYGAAGPLNVRSIAESIEYGNLSRLRDTIVRPAHKAGLLDFNNKSGIVILSPLGVRYVETKIPLEL